MPIKGIAVVCINYIESKYFYLIWKSREWKNKLKNRKWKNINETSIHALEEQLDVFNQNPLRENYNQNGLLYEILLFEGFTLCSIISKITEIKSNLVKKITSEYCDHSLLVCLDSEIKTETIKELQLSGADIFICLDSAISLEDKLRLSDRGMIKTI